MDDFDEGLMAMRFYPNNGNFGPHYDVEEKGEFHETPDNGSNDTEETENTESEIGYITIGNFYHDIPKGLAWQWKSERLLEGFLYGEVDEKGRFTGEEVTYIYPDLLTGLHGKFLNGEVVEARAVDIVAERCHQGMKQIKMRLNKKAETVWKVEHSTSVTSPYAKTMEPHEKKSVYVGSSQLGGDSQITGDGIFARRLFFPGDLVSYFSGVKTLEEEMFMDNMTAQEEYEASRYYFGLYDAAPLMWGLDKVKRERR